MEKKMNAEDYKNLLIEVSKTHCDWQIFNKEITGRHRMPLVESGVEAGNIEIYFDLYDEFIRRVLINGEEVFNNWESNEDFWSSDDAVLKLAEAIACLSPEERKALFRLEKIGGEKVS